MTFYYNVQKKSVGLEPVINSSQFPVHCGINIVNVTVGCPPKILPSNSQMEQPIKFT